MALARRAIIDVVRRVGGLEDPRRKLHGLGRVVRRVGGLEGVGGYHM